MDRILRLVRSPEREDDQSYGDFYVVAGEFGSLTVSRETARYIERQLDRRPMPEWLVFRDRVGSRIRVRTRHVNSFVESTARQRAADRRLDRARQREQDADSDGLAGCS
jgi:hypothetical protein